MFTAAIPTSEAMLDFARDFAAKLSKSSAHATVIELIGDVGAGKTTFTRGLAAGLGISESITSPSFTISKRYPLKSGGELIHYDFYRLQDPGLMAEDFAESIADSQNIVVVEWGDSLADFLPDDRIKIEIKEAENGRQIFAEFLSRSIAQI